MKDDIEVLKSEIKEPEGLFERLSRKLFGLGSKGQKLEVLQQAVQYNEQLEELTG